MSGTNTGTNDYPTILLFGLFSDSAAVRLPRCISGKEATRWLYSSCSVSANFVVVSRTPVSVISVVRVSRLMNCILLLSGEIR